MGESGPIEFDSKSELHARHQRTYQTMIVVAVLLAVVGSPLLMTGCAGFVDAVSTGGLTSSASTLACFMRLAVFSSPLAIAGLTWHRARAMERVLEAEDLEKYSHH